MYGNLPKSNRIIVYWSYNGFVFFSFVWSFVCFGWYIYKSDQTTRPKIWKRLYYVYDMWTVGTSKVKSKTNWNVVFLLKRMSHIRYTLFALIKRIKICSFVIHAPSIIPNKWFYFCWLNFTLFMPILRSL